MGSSSTIFAYTERGKCSWPQYSVNSIGKPMYNYTPVLSEGYQFQWISWFGFQSKVTNLPTWTIHAPGKIPAWLFISEIGELTLYGKVDKKLKNVPEGARFMFPTDPTLSTAKPKYGRKLPLASTIVTGIFGCGCHHFLPIIKQSVISFLHSASYGLTEVSSQSRKHWAQYLSF